MRSTIVLVLLILGSTMTVAQDRLPIIDMHLHALAADSQGPPPLGICAPFEEFPTWDPGQPFEATFMAMLKEPSCADPVWSPETDEEVMQQTIEVMNRRNVIGVLSGSLERVAKWRAEAFDRIIPAAQFNLARDTNLTTDVLRTNIESDRVQVLGEITNQYAGIAPDDERMEPYWALAEELDIPAGIHIGPGPPGVVYMGSLGYRARLHSALTLEEVLVRHPRLRIYIMHAGFPLLDDLLALLYVHPQVHVEVGVIAFTQPRSTFYRFLQGIVDAGFGKRVMFGSDQMVWPGVIERAITAVEEAPFLDQEQKRDLLYNNAARFLRLSEAEIARHHSL